MWAVSGIEIRRLALSSRPSYFWLRAGLTRGLNTSGFLDKKKEN